MTDTTTALTFLDHLVDCRECEGLMFEGSEMGQVCPIAELILEARELQYGLYQCFFPKSN